MIRGTQNTDHPIERQGSGWRRPGLWLVVALFAAGAFFAYPSVSRWARSDRSIEASRVRLATVTRGDLERDVTVEGRVVAAYHPTLFSPAPGLVRLKVQPGEAVTAQQVLAVIESPELASRLEQERSSLQSMHSELERQTLAARQQDLENDQAVDLLKVRTESAKRAMDRAQRTFDEGVTGEADYERAVDDLKVTRLELEHTQRRAELEHERARFETRNRELQVERQQLLVAELERQVTELAVRAPVAGIASRIEVEDRDAVTVGQPIVTVVDLSSFEVEIGVPESYASEVAIGTAAAVRLGGEIYPGEIRRIAPEVTGSVVQGRLAFTAEAPSGLKQNQRVTTRLILDARRDVLKVSRGPFLEDGGGKRAWIVEDDVARPHTIETGAVSVSEVEIRSGLEAGDRIIISDTARFADADNVLIRR